MLQHRKRTTEPAGITGIESKYRAGLFGGFVAGAVLVRWLVFFLFGLLLLTCCLLSSRLHTLILLNCWGLHLIICVLDFQSLANKSTGYHNIVFIDLVAFGRRPESCNEENNHVSNDGFKYFRVNDSRSGPPRHRVRGENQKTSSV